jgi:hypothetical protein
VTLERRLNDPALHAAAAAVHEADFDHSRRRSGAHVLLDDGRNIARRECVQVNLGLDENARRPHEISDRRFQIVD